MNQKIKPILIILGIILLLVVCYFIGESENQKYNKITGQSELNEINIDEYLKLKASSDASVIYIARPTCSHCQTQTPRMKQIKHEYNVEINYLNTDEFKDGDFEKLEASDKFFKDEEWGTPLIMIVKDDKILDKIEGEASIAEVTEMFKENGLM